MKTIIELKQEMHDAHDAWDAAYRILTTARKAYFKKLEEEEATNANVIPRD